MGIVGSICYTVVYPTQNRMSGIFEAELIVLGWSGVTLGMKKENIFVSKKQTFFFSSVRTHFPNCCLPLHPNLFKKGDAIFDDAFTRFEVVLTRLRIVKGSHS